MVLLGTRQPHSYTHTPDPHPKYAIDPSFPRKLEGPTHRESLSQCLPSPFACGLSSLFLSFSSFPLSLSSSCSPLVPPFFFLLHLLHVLLLLLDPRVFFIVILLMTLLQLITCVSHSLLPADVISLFISSSMPTFLSHHPPLPLSATGEGKKETSSTTWLLEF